MAEQKRKRITPERLKEIQLEILDYVISFCDSHGMKYSLQAGTLLGAIRHKGFIPWDDDIDISMPREDYNRFLREFNESAPSYYVCRCIENDKTFTYPIIKVLDKRTVFYLRDENGPKLCVNIDIFPVDSVDLDEKGIKKLFAETDKYSVLNWIRSGRMGRPRSKNKLKDMVYWAIHMLRKLRPENYYCKKIVKNVRKHSVKDGPMLGCFMGYVKPYGRKECYESLIDFEFEGKLYKVPVGYDEWLTNTYGDYMTPPPVEKRVNPHTSVAYELIEE